MFTTATTVGHLECATVTFSRDNNVVSITGESRRCCMKVEALDNSNLDQFTYNVKPSKSSCPFTLPETGTTKLIDKIQVGDNICFVIIICRQSKEGIWVICRKPEQTKDLVDIILQLLFKLIGLLLLPQLKSITQGSTCLYGSYCIG